MTPKMETLHVLGHLELGDAVLLNGLINTLCGKHKSIKWFVSPEYVPEVQNMMQDSRIVVCPAEGGYEDPGAKWFDKFQPQLRLGCFGKNFDWAHWDFSQYQQAKIPFNNRWTHFRHAAWGRQTIFRPEPNRVFLHERADKGTVITRFNPPPGVEVVRVCPGVRRFASDWVREEALRASEIHVVDSAFLCMLDSIYWPAEGVKFFFHAYAKKYNPENWTGWPALRNPWQILL